jgi:hypothetical protein
VLGGRLESDEDIEEVEEDIVTLKLRVRGSGMDMWRCFGVGRVGDVVFR